MDATTSHRIAHAAPPVVLPPPEEGGERSAPGKMKTAKRTVSARGDPLKRTPKKVTAALRRLKESDLGYDLTRSAKRVLFDGMEELYKMSPSMREKRAELLIRWRDRLDDLALTEELKGAKFTSPRKHRGLVSRISGSDWAGPMADDLTRAFNRTPDADKRDWIPRPLHLDHISTFSPKAGGLHLCDPTSPFWSMLEARTTLSGIDTYGALVRSPGKVKFSSFWPVGTTERDLITMHASGEVIARKHNEELLVVTLPSGRKTHAVRYGKPGFVGSFFPIFCCNHVTVGNPKAFTFDFINDMLPPVTAKVVVKTEELLAQAKAMLGHIAFEDRDRGLVYIDYTSYLLTRGLPAIFPRGFLFCFVMDEIGYAIEESGGAAGGAAEDAVFPSMLGKSIRSRSEGASTSIPALEDLRLMMESRAEMHEEEDDIVFETT